MRTRILRETNNKTPLNTGVESEPTMAKVQAQVVGGSILPKEASTIADLKEQMNLEGNYQATVNGEPQDSDYELSDYEFVSFAKQVKGA